MTLISLVCLLALSSSAFGRSVSSYGGYGSSSMQIPSILTATRDQTIQRPFLQSLPVVSQGYGQQQQQQPVDWSSIGQQQQQPVQQKVLGGYGSSVQQKTLPVSNYGQVNQGYGGGMTRMLFDQQPQTQPQPQPEVPILTPADLLCQGQQAETVIPLEGGRKFVVCLDESKGVEQQCPKGLFYHQQSRRCERKLGPLESPCASQPCLNGGQCAETDSSFQCQCAPGFDGQICELDARVCQTQQPCGQAPDTKCQSFRLGAALQYICILQDGHAYGLSAQQAQQSPCQDVDGPHGLGLSDKGFIMCDGERMFVESCPGGTIWDDLNKACVWPDMQASAPQQDQPQGYGQSSYGQQRTLINKQQQGGQIPAPRHHHHHQHHAKHLQSSYGTQIPLQRSEQPNLISSYGNQVNWQQQEQPKLVQSYGGQVNWQQQEQPKLVQSFGGQVDWQQPEQQKPVPSFGGQVNWQQPEQQKPVPSFGGQVNWQQPTQQKLVSSYGSQQRDLVVPQQQPSGY